MADVTKVLLDESEIPTAWYNLVPDLPAPPPPPLHPGTLEPVGPDDLLHCSCRTSSPRKSPPSGTWTSPARSSTLYSCGGPPLYRARRLEKALDTPPAST